MGSFCGMEVLQRMRHGAGAERALVTDREPLALQCALRSGTASGLAGAATSEQHSSVSAEAHLPLSLKVQPLITGNDEQPEVSPSG